MSEEPAHGLESRSGLSEVLVLVLVLIDWLIDDDDDDDDELLSSIMIPE